MADCLQRQYPSLPLVTSKKYNVPSLEFASIVQLLPSDKSCSSQSFRYQKTYLPHVYKTLDQCASLNIHQSDSSSGVIHARNLK